MQPVIAKATPFEGAPVLHTPAIYGISTGKTGILYKIPVTGALPITLQVEGLPEGLTFDGSILRGSVSHDLETDVTIIAENRLGRTEKSMRLEVRPDHVLRTPLMGFTTWNAFASGVTQEDTERTARDMVRLGLDKYGYCYVNLDSGWQKDTDTSGVIRPNKKFPNMKSLCDTIHALGLKCGIYSTPMLTAWGCPEEFQSIPGCTSGEPNFLFTRTNGGIGQIRNEPQNASQWAEWGFDYLKYDWSPADPSNAEPMKQALLACHREFAFCVTVTADPAYAPYWISRCNSWRNNQDSVSCWDNLMRRLNTVEQWQGLTAPGHFYDLDMLEIGVTSFNRGEEMLTEAEKLFSYTLRAFFQSPIQLSCRLEQLTEFERNLICNDEIIALHQDSLCCYPTRVQDSELPCGIRVFQRRLENGDTAFAIFNTSEENKTVSLSVEKAAGCRDVWKKELLGDTGKDCFTGNTLSFTVDPHFARVFRFYSR